MRGGGGGLVEVTADEVATFFSQFDEDGDGALSMVEVRHNATCSLPMPLPAAGNG